MASQKLSGRQVLAGAVKGQRRDVVVGTLLGACHQFGEALVPVLIGVVIDRAVSKGDSGALVRWLAVLALMYVGLSLGFRFGARAGSGPQNRPPTSCGWNSYDVSSTPAAASSAGGCRARWPVSPPRTPSGSGPSTWP